MKKILSTFVIAFIAMVAFSTQGKSQTLSLQNNLSYPVSVTYNGLTLNAGANSSASNSPLVSPFNCSATVDFGGGCSTTVNFTPCPPAIIPYPNYSYNQFSVTLPAGCTPATFTFRIVLYSTGGGLITLVP